MAPPILNIIDMLSNKATIIESEFANRTDLINIEIPSTVTEISDFAFEKCPNLESIVIPDSVQKIGVAAFCECTSLKKVVLPNSITVIEDLLFGLCESLEEVVLPDTVKAIRPQAFRECKALIAITLPNTVETIGAHCFDGCISLCECNCPTALKQVEGYAFFNTPIVNNTRYTPEETLVLANFSELHNVFSENMDMTEYLSILSEWIVEHPTGNVGDYMPLKKGYVFISYSSKNQASADNMRNLLHKHHIATWMAPYDIPAGSEYAEVLYEALLGCSCVLLILTRDSQESLWVKKEVNIAISNMKKIIPVKLDDVELNSSMKLYLNDQQIVKVFAIEENSETIQKIINQTKDLTYGTKANLVCQ